MWGCFAYFLVQCCLAGSVGQSYSINVDDLHESYCIEYHNARALEMMDLIGQGKYAEVYRAKLNNMTVAAKVLKPTEAWRIKREVKFLQELQGVPNMIKFFGVFGDELSPILVTEWVESTKSSLVSYRDLKWIMRELFRSLNDTHYRHIFHRDVKWQNLLVSFKDRVIRVIDWGLAEYIIKDAEYSACVGTKSYKAPELLMDWELYGPGIDIWAAGVVMANLVFGCPSFFSAPDVKGVLGRQTRLFGNRRMKKLAKRYEYSEPLPYQTSSSFLEFALPHTRHLITNESLDLLGELITPEPELRTSAGDALCHPFFAD